MVTMLAIMKDTDDHFKEVSDKLEIIRRQAEGKLHLSVVKPLDSDK